MRVATLQQVYRRILAPVAKIKRSREAPDLRVLVQIERNVSLSTVNGGVKVLTLNTAVLQPFFCYLSTVACNPCCLIFAEVLRCKPCDIPIPVRRHLPEPLHPGVLIRWIPLPRSHRRRIDRKPRAHAAAPEAGRARSLWVAGVAQDILCDIKPHFVSHK